MTSSKNSVANKSRQYNSYNNNGSRSSSSNIEIFLFIIL
jgi:hypothetical protein